MSKGREIKFRIAYKSPSNDNPRKWLISEPLTPHEMMFSEDTQVDFIGGGYLRFNEMGEDGEGQIIFEQWTGFTDDGGTPIFEGDIVDGGNGATLEEPAENWRVVVKWDEEYSKWVAHDPYMGENHDLGDFNGLDKVVGNIHQNRKLLDGVGK